MTKEEVSTKRLIDLAARFVELKASIDMQQKELESIRSKILEKNNIPPTISDGDRTFKIDKNEYARTTLDTTALKAEKPEIYMLYSKEIQVTTLKITKIQ